MLVVRQFQYEVEVSFNMIIYNGQLSRTNYYITHSEFQERGSPYVNSFMWIFNTTNIQNKVAYTALIEKTISKQLPDHLNDPEFSE